MRALFSKPQSEPTIQSGQEKIGDPAKQPSSPRFKSKEEYTQWKEEKLSNTQVSKKSICPHCDEAISASVNICPYCAENVKNTAPSSPTCAATVGDIVKTPEKEVVIEKTIEEKLPSSDELDPVKIKMRKLETLLKDGIITQEEFTKKKQQIIDEYLIA